MVNIKGSLNRSELNSAYGEQPLPPLVQRRRTHLQPLTCIHRPRKTTPTTSRNISCSIYLTCMKQIVTTRLLTGSVRETGLKPFSYQWGVRSSEPDLSWKCSNRTQEPVNPKILHQSASLHNSIGNMHRRSISKAASQRPQSLRASEAGRRSWAGERLCKDEGKLYACRYFRKTQRFTAKDRSCDVLQNEDDDDCSDMKQLIIKQQFIVAVACDEHEARLSCRARPGWVALIDTFIQLALIWFHLNKLQIQQPQPDHRWHQVTEGKVIRLLATCAYASTQCSSLFHLFNKG